MTTADDDAQSASRLVLRFVTGCASLASVQITTDLRAASDGSSLDRGPITMPGLPRSVRRWVGLCVRAPLYARAAATRAERSRARAAETLAPVRRWIGQTSLGRRIETRTDAWRTRLNEELALAEELGESEELEGRVLASQTLRTIADRALATLGDNADLRELVATQSATMTGMAVDELRAAAVDADTRVESALRRWLDGLRRGRGD